MYDISPKRCIFRARSFDEKRCGNVYKDALIRYLLVHGTKPIFEKIIEGIETKKEALDLEGLMIREIGTLELGTGPLVNVHAIGVRKRRKAIDVMFGLMEAAA